MRDHSPVTISVVVPCYQEADRVGSAIDGYFQCVEASGLSAELIIVDNGSTDGTATRARALLEEHSNAQCITLPHPGKGAAIQAGSGAAKGQWVVLGDADWSMSPVQVTSLLPEGLKGQR